MRLTSMSAIARMAALAGTLLLGAGAATAAPMPGAPVTGVDTAMIQPAVATGNDAKLILVRGGCGWGAHRSWYGHCRYNHGWRGHVRAWRRWHHWRRW